MTNIVIGIPNNGTLSSETAFGLFDALSRDHTDRKLITRIVESQNLFVDFNRNVIAEGFINYFKDDWLLFLDSDIEVTLEEIYDLYDIAVSNNLDVIGGIYFYSRGHRSMDLRPAVQIKLSNGKKTDLIDIDFNKDYFKVDSMGTGMMLISRKALQQSYKIDGNGIPYWFKTYDEYGTFIAEDVYFCNTLKESGIDVYACPKVTPRHIKLSAFNRYDFIKQKNINR